MHWSNELDWPQWWCPQLFVFRWCLGRIAQCSASCRQPCRTEWIKNVLGNHFLKRNKLCMIWWVVDTTTTILKNLAGGIVDDGVKAREGCACGICDVAGFRVSFLGKNSTDMRGDGPTKAAAEEMTKTRRRIFMVATRQCLQKLGPSPPFYTPHIRSNPNEDCKIGFMDIIPAVCDVLTQVCRLVNRCHCYSTLMTHFC